MLKSSHVLRVALAGAVLWCAVSAGGAEPRRPASRNPAPAAETVELFAAIEAGQVEVKMIPKDSKQSTLLVENKTKQPLNVRLPEVFAGVPTLNQQDGGGGSQPVGGGGGAGAGGGVFNVPAEKLVKQKLATVCLEHGKDEPRSSIAYTIKPLDTVTKNAETREVLKLLADGKCSQRVAQAAVWHFANGLSWEQLTAKQNKHLDGSSEPYFPAAEIKAAMAMANEVVRIVEGQPKRSPGETTSAQAK